MIKKLTVLFLLVLPVSSAQAEDRLYTGQVDEKAHLQGAGDDRGFWRRWSESDTATGDWFGLRPSLRDDGVEMLAYLNSQYQGIVKGGTGTTSRHSASLDVFLALDLEKAFGLRDTEFLIQAQSNFGNGINPYSGSSFQVNDDADGFGTVHVAQLWFRRHFADRRISLTMGYVDFQTMADRNAYANSEDKQFMHQALDNNPLFPLGPGLGVALTLRPVNWYTFLIGLRDAQSVLFKPGFSTAFHEENWWFGYMEHAFHVELDSHNGPLRGNYRAGLIYDPSTREVFQDDDIAGRPRFRGDDYGFYASIDQKIYRESPDDDQGLGVFGRFGYRTSETNLFSRFISAGVEYRGLFHGRDRDVFGFGMAMTKYSEDYEDRVMEDADRETVYELYYAIRVNDWLVVTPDVQYIDNPGGTGEYANAITAGVRARISF